jgi:hypothetical protein
MLKPRQAGEIFLVLKRTFNPLVAGSNPARPTKISQRSPRIYVRGLFVSGRFGKYSVTAGQRPESRRARVIAAELASLDYTPLARNDGADVLTELVALQLPRPSHR